MEKILGRPVEEALSFLPADAPPPHVTVTSAPRREGPRQEGTLRVVACRNNEWIAARFLDRSPRETEET